MPIQLSDNSLMESIVKYLAPYFQQANEEFKDKCKIRMITFVNAHDLDANCDVCKDEPIACLRCVVTLFPNESQNDSSAA